MDTSAAGWPTHSVGGKGPAAGLFFDGPIATAVHGGRVPLYSPTTFAMDGSFHKIRVRSNVRNATVRVRSGYYAPLPEEQP